MKIKQADELAFLLSQMLQVKGIIGYKIARNLRMINDELKEFYDIKQGLFNIYGKELDNGQIIIETNGDNYKEYQKDIAPYEDQEVNFDFKLISEEEFMNSDLTAEQIMILTEYFSE